MPAYDARDHMSREELMSTPQEQFEEMPLLPAGHYFGQITRHEFTQVGENNTDALDYFVQLIEPAADVASEAAGIPLREYEQRARFFITKRAMFRLRYFHKSLGYSESLPADAVIPETTGARVLLTISKVSLAARGNRPAREINSVDEIVGAGIEAGTAVAA